MNNRGGFILASEELWWVFVRLVFTIFIAFIVFFIVYIGNARKLDIGDLEGQVILRSLLMNTDCFVYEDVRAYPGMVDLKKFSEGFDDCIGGDFGIRLRMLFDNREEMGFIHKDFFEEEERFCIFPEYKCSEEVFPVLVIDGENIFDGKLNLKLVLKNE